MACFLVASNSDVLGHLAGNQRHRQVEQAQILAWRQQIEILRVALTDLPRGHLFLEFEIPRVGRRADAVLLLGALVIVIEFKVGATQYDAASIDQVFDYALDLKNFHRASHDAAIIPVLVATAAPAERLVNVSYEKCVSRPLRSNREGFASLLRHIDVSGCTAGSELSALQWACSPYSPTPTIVEAARALYQGHQVENLSRSDAGATNLSRTCCRIGLIIDEAKRVPHKAICFVTGVPWSGKTLAGLNVATERMRSNEEEHAVFLSGNGPLVAVLQEALAQDELARRIDSIKVKKSEAERKAKAFIQNVHYFRGESLKTTWPPAERVVVFDEAQRAWDRTKLQGS